MTALQEKPPRRRGLGSLARTGDGWDEAEAAGSDVLSEYPRREIAWGLTVAGLFLLALFGWGLWARLDSAVSAPGQVVVSGNRQTVQHRDGGIVTALNVREGDRVRAGQELLRLNADELSATERSDADQVIELQALQARLTAELRSAKAIAAPVAFAAMTGRDRASADAAMALQRREFDTRRVALETEESVLTQKVRESSEQITGYSRQAAANREQQRLIAQEIGGLVTLQARGLVPATRVRSLQRNAAELQGNEGEYNADIARTQQEIGESRIRVSDLERQRAADDSKDYQTAEFQLAELQPKLAAVRGQIARTVVRAPATGKVVGLSIFTVGGVVQPGQKLMEVVPENEPLVLEARVKPSDVSDLRIGQRTEIKITGFHERGMPLLHGVVSKISADSLNDEKTGQPYFRIEATVPASELALIRQVRGDAPGLKAGLPVDVIVPLRRRNALQYLTEPLQQALWKSFREH